MGSLWKQIYRYTHPRTYRHSENLWPHVKIKRAGEGHITALSWHGRNIPIEDLTKLHGSHIEPIAIIATGPSVKTLDMTKLAQVATLGVNGAFSLKDQIRFSYYVIVDRDFVKNRFNIVRQIISDKHILLFITPHCLNDIFQTLGTEAVKCRLALVEDVRHKVYQALIEPADYYKLSQMSDNIVLSGASHEIGFSTDIRQGIIDAGTVAYWALQIAFFLGTKSVLLAGVDMNNFSAPRFYESSTDIMPSLLESNFVNLIKPSFVHASQLLREECVQVYNLSLNSALGNEIFRKVSLNDL